MADDDDSQGDPEDDAGQSRDVLKSIGTLLKDIETDEQIPENLFGAQPWLRGVQPEFDWGGNDGATSYDDEVASRKYWREAEAKRAEYGFWFTCVLGFFVMVGYITWACLVVQADTAATVWHTTPLEHPASTPPWLRVNSPEALTAFAITMGARASVFVGLTVLAFGLARFLKEMTTPFSAQIKMAEAKRQSWLGARGATNFIKELRGLLADNTKP